jgi:hypothetical protein
MLNEACSSARAVNSVREWRALLGLLLGLGLPLDVAADETAIRAAFGRYRDALLARDGSGAAAAVTGTSHAYYERLRDLALHADRRTLERQGLAEQVAILRLRHEFTAAELTPLSGSELIATSVAESWDSSNALQRLHIDKVDLQEGEALATVLPSSDGEPLSYRFELDHGEWKLDLVHLAQSAEPILAQALDLLARRTRTHGTDVLVLAVEHSSGHLVEKDLLAPLRAGQP